MPARFHPLFKSILRVFFSQQPIESTTRGQARQSCFETETQLVFCPRSPQVRDTATLHLMGSTLCHRGNRRSSGGDATPPEGQRRAFFSTGCLTKGQRRYRVGEGCGRARVFDKEKDRCVRDRRKSACPQQPGPKRAPDRLCSLQPFKHPRPHFCILSRVRQAPASPHLTASFPRRAGSPGVTQPNSEHLLQNHQRLRGLVPNFTPTVQAFLRRW